MRDLAVSPSTNQRIADWARLTVEIPAQAAHTHSINADRESVYIMIAPATSPASDRVPGNIAVDSGARLQFAWPVTSRTEVEIECFRQFFNVPSTMQFAIADQRRLSPHSFARRLESAAALDDYVATEWREAVQRAFDEGR